MEGGARMMPDFNCGDCSNDPLEGLTNDELIEALQCSFIYDNGINEDHIIKLEELVQTYRKKGAD